MRSIRQRQPPRLSRSCSTHHSLPFVALDQLLIFAFYSRKDTRTPMLVGLLGVGIYLVAGLTLIGPAGMGLYGLVLANTIQNTLHAIVLFALLIRAIGSLRERGIGRAAMMSVVASLPVGVVCYLGSLAVPATPSLVQSTLVVTATLVLAGVAYLAGLRILGVDELQSLRTAVARVRGRPTVSSDAPLATSPTIDSRP